MSRKILVVLSGGQDSTTCLYQAIYEHGVENVHAVTFNYGQKHQIEVMAALTIGSMAGLGRRHEVIRIADILESTSPLTDKSVELEQYENADQMEKVIGNRVEKTFVPMRNTLFLTIAFNRAVALGCETIYTGVCQEDNANYPDCTLEFINRFEHAANVSLGSIKGGKIVNEKNLINIQTPLMSLSKAQTCQKGYTLPGCWEALAYSHTSYDGKYPPTDMNHANVLRAKGFEDAGLPDPLVVRAWREGLMPLPDSKNYDGVIGTKNA